MLPTYVPGFNSTQSGHNISPSHDASLGEMGKRAKLRLMDFHAARDNKQFIKEMTLLFHYCDLANIVKLFKSEISLEECCRDTKRLASQIVISDWISQSPVFLEESPSSHKVNPKAKEIALLLDVCKFGFWEDEQKAMKKVEHLSSLLMIPEKGELCLGVLTQVPFNSVLDFIEQKKVGQAVREFLVFLSKSSCVEEYFILLCQRIGGLTILNEQINQIQNEQLDAELIPTLDFLRGRIAHNIQGVEGVRPNHDEAMTWYLKAAEAGNAGGMNNIGFMYLKGHGVKQDDQQVMAWFKKAAEAGNAEAMSNIGSRYMKGHGVKQDDQQAMAWFKKAAEAGNADAMNNIGFMYHDGHGVKQDDQQAMEWDKKAKAAGCLK